MSSLHAYLNRCCSCNFKFNSLIEVSLHQIYHTLIFYLTKNREYFFELSSYLENINLFEITFDILIAAYHPKPPNFLPKNYMSTRFYYILRNCTLKKFMNFITFIDTPRNIFLFQWHEKYEDSCDEIIKLFDNNYCPLKNKNLDWYKKSVFNCIRYYD